MCRYADEVWRQLIRVPFMAKFVIFAKRSDANESNLRVFCMTDDKEDERGLEQQEHYEQIAKSRDVQVIEGQKLWLEFGGNLVPHRLGGSARHLNRHWAPQPISEQLNFTFKPFEENRLAFVARLKDVGREPSGRIAFMRDSIRWLGSLPPHQRAYMLEDPNRPVCTLGLRLPPICVQYDDILGTPRRNSYLANTRIGRLSLAEIATSLDSHGTNNILNWQQSNDLDHDSLSQAYESTKPDWVRLAPKLGVPRDEMDIIAEQWPRLGAIQNDSPTLGLLLHWLRLSENQDPYDREQDLARALLSIGRNDVVDQLGFALELKPSNVSSRTSLHEITLNGNGHNHNHNQRNNTNVNSKQVPNQRGGSQEAENLYANGAVLDRQIARARLAEEAEAEVEAERRQRRRSSSRSRSRNGSQDAGSGGKF